MKPPSPMGVTSWGFHNRWSQTTLKTTQIALKDNRKEAHEWAPISLWHHMIIEWITIPQYFITYFAEIKH